VRAHSVTYVRARVARQGLEERRRQARTRAERRPDPKPRFASAHDNAQHNRRDYGNERQKWTLRRHIAPYLSSLRERRRQPPHTRCILQQCRSRLEPVADCQELLLPVRRLFSRRRILCEVRLRTDVPSRHLRWRRCVHRDGGAWPLRKLSFELEGGGGGQSAHLLPEVRQLKPDGRVLVRQT